MANLLFSTAVHWAFSNIVMSYFSPQCIFIQRDGAETFGSSIKRNWRNWWAVSEFTAKLRGWWTIKHLYFNSYFRASRWTIKFLNFIYICISVLSVFLIVSQEKIQETEFTAKSSPADGQSSWPKHTYVFVLQLYFRLSLCCICVAFVFPIVPQVELEKLLGSVWIHGRWTIKLAKTSVILFTVNLSKWPFFHALLWGCPNLWAWTKFNGPIATRRFLTFNKSSLSPN